MVLYYSATGNTKYIAELLAKSLDDEALDLLERIRKSDFSPIRSASPFVICSPIYVCEMPRFLVKFLKAVRLAGNRSVYFVFTSGGYTGIAGFQAARIIKKKNMVFGEMILKKAIVPQSI